MMNWIRNWTVFYVRNNKMKIITKQRRCALSPQYWKACILINQPVKYLKKQHQFMLRKKTALKSKWNFKPNLTILYGRIVSEIWIIFFALSENNFRQQCLACLKTASKSKQTYWQFNRSCRGMIYIGVIACQNKNNCNILMHYSKV